MARRFGGRGALCAIGKIALLALLCLLSFTFGQPQMARTVSLRFTVTGDIYAFGDLNSDGYTDVVTYLATTKTLQCFTGSNAGINIKPINIGSLSDSGFIKDGVLVNVLLLDVQGAHRPSLIVTLQEPGKSVFHLYLVPITNENGALSTGLTRAMGKFSSEPTILDVCGKSTPLFLGHMTEKNEVGSKLYMFDGSIMMEVTMDTNTHDVCQPMSAHSNAYLDIDGDCLPELFIMCKDNKYMLLGINSDGDKITMIHSAVLPSDLKSYIAFADVTADGAADAVYITCSAGTCNIMIAETKLKSGTRNPAKLCMQDRLEFLIDFAKARSIYEFKSSASADQPPIRLIVGDWNLNGQADFIFVSDSEIHIVVDYECINGVCKFRRDELLKKDYMIPVDTFINTVAMFDLYENGIPGLVISSRKAKEDSATMFLEKNNKEDAFLIKSCIIRVRCTRDDCVGFGSVSIGSSTRVLIRNVKGEQILAQVHQMIQTSSKALQLPCALVGLGRTTNFLPALQVVAEQCKPGQFSEVVPNSQLVFTSNAQDKWELYMVLQGNEHKIKVCIVVGAMLVLIGGIAGAFQWQEKIADSRQRTYWM